MKDKIFFGIIFSLFLISYILAIFIDKQEPVIQTEYNKTFVGYKNEC